MPGHRADTPGGLLDSASKIVESLYDSKIPIVVYVARPRRGRGVREYSSPWRRMWRPMAPHTRIGAAHPVELGASGSEEKTDDGMKKKIENDTASFAQSIAQKRNRNADWAKSAVLDSASITAEEALDSNVIDLIADNLPDLLKQLDQRDQWQAAGYGQGFGGGDTDEHGRAIFGIVPAAGGDVHPDVDGHLWHHG